MWFLNTREVFDRTELCHFRDSSATTRRELEARRGPSTSRWKHDRWARTCWESRCSRNANRLVVRLASPMLLVESLKNKTQHKIVCIQRINQSLFNKQKMNLRNFARIEWFAIFDVFVVFEQFRVVSEIRIEKKKKKNV